MQLRFNLSDRDDFKKINYNKIKSVKFVFNMYGILKKNWKGIDFLKATTI